MENNLLKILFPLTFVILSGCVAQPPSLRPIHVSELAWDNCVNGYSTAISARRAQALAQNYFIERCGVPANQENHINASIEIEKCVLKVALKESRACEDGGNTFFIDARSGVLLGMEKTQSKK